MIVEKEDANGVQAINGLSRQDDAHLLAEDFGGSLVASRRGGRSHCCHHGEKDEAGLHGAVRCGVLCVVSGERCARVSWSITATLRWNFCMSSTGGVGSARWLESMGWSFIHKNGIILKY